MDNDRTPLEPPVYELREKEEVPAWVNRMAEVMATIGTVAIFIGFLVLLVAGVKGIVS